MPLLESFGSGSARAFGLNASRGLTSRNLIGYWDPGLTTSAPTGSNGNIWVDVSGSATTMGNVNIKGHVNDWSYGGSGLSGYVFNTTSRDAGNLGMPVSLTNFSKLKGTLEQWIYPTEYVGSNGLFMNRTDSAPNDSNWFWWGPYGDGGSYYFRTGFNSPTSDCCTNDLSQSTDSAQTTPWSTAVPLNAWKHVTITWDLTPALPLSQQYKRIYINGQLWSQRTGMAGQSSTTNVNSTGVFGAGHNGGVNAQWKGRFGVMRMYNDVLSGAEIAGNFDTFKGRYI